MSSTIQPGTAGDWAPSAAAAASATPGPGRRWWALAGVGAGIAGIGGVIANLGISAVYDEDAIGDAVAVTDNMRDMVGEILAFHVLTLAGLPLLAVFAAGLARRLRAGLGPASLAPTVALVGLVLVMVAQLMGTSLDTEIIFGLQAPEDELAPEFAVTVGHWLGTVPWVWIGAGMSALAVGVAGVRHRAVPRWLGWAGLVLGLATLLLGISPLQYMAAFFGPLWLLATALGFAFGDRRTQGSASGTATGVPAGHSAG
ncbi:hypothetical protein [Jiangella gansuensis]|uniref:hypothetical protein n=1 Tax=Jiangella gansuensis TaxID=281473 RepID=UPI0004AF8D09|nr:hypothetical protein [Jiangella gansuensis]